MGSLMEVSQPRSVTGKSIALRSRSNAPQAKDTTEYQAAFSPSELTDSFDGGHGEAPDILFFTCLVSYPARKKICSATKWPHSDGARST